VQVVGDGSEAMLSLRPGTRVLIEGPYGRLSPRALTQRKVALVGAGVGITPLRALAEGLTYAPGDAILVQRYTREPLFAREFQALAEQRGLLVLALPGHRRSTDSWLGQGIGSPAQVGDAEALRRWIPDIAERDVYVCGPEHWTDLVKRTLDEAGLPSDQFHLETFKW
jgi:ferredoxin-NADP reductase